MQALDVQSDMQPIHYTDAAQPNGSYKKEAAEPEQKGSSFLAMKKKLTAQASEAADAAPEMPEDMQADFAALIKMSGARKDKTAAQPEAKAKEPSKKAVLLNASASQTNTEPALDARTIEQDALLAAVQEADVLKDISDAGAGKERRTSSTLIDADLPDSEEALPVIADELPFGKKQKAGTSASGLETGVKAAALEIRSERKEENGEQERSGSIQAGHKLQHTKHQKPLFTVIDERTAQFAPVTDGGSVHESGAAVRVEHSQSSIDMVMDFRGQSAGFGAKAESALFSKESGAPSFAALVSQQIQDMSSDFVQAGKIVLQDNNAGLIRLQLQPAHLGNVRISLELTGGKKITGKIIAASKEAYDAFKENIEQLAEAFEQGGFESAHFDVSWSGESGGQHFADADSSFNERFMQNNRIEVMQDNRYADTQLVYAFGQDQAVNVFA